MGVKVKLELFGHDIQSPRRKDRVVTYNVIARPVAQARFSIPTLLHLPGTFNQSCCTAKDRYNTSGVRKKNASVLLWMIIQIHESLEPFKFIPLSCVIKVQRVIGLDSNLKIVDYSRAI